MTLCINSFAPIAIKFDAVHISIEFLDENLSSKGMFIGQNSLKVSTCMLK